jgi:hypothetical protein
VEVSRILSEIDWQISKLQQARALLAGTSTPTASAAPVAPARRGRPKGSKNSVKKATAKTPATTAKVAAPAAKGKRKLSAEGRKRIADAMKKRWAERRKQAAK